MITVEISFQLRNELISYCQALLPKESCGVLLGHALNTANGQTIIVESFEPMPNVAPNPLCQFEFDRDEWIRFLFAQEKKTSRLIGIFHNHPNGSNTLSTIDSATLWHSLPCHAIITHYAEKTDITCFTIHYDGTCKKLALVPA